MVIFGLDRSLQDNSARLAVSAALEMMRAMPAFNQYLLKHFGHEFRIGIGIHTGNVVVGSLGYHKKKEYTALGDTVNTASRIEAVNKKAGTNILVSERTHALIKKRVCGGETVRCRSEGKTGSAAPVRAGRPVAGQGRWRKESRAWRCLPVCRKPI